MERVEVARPTRRAFWSLGRREAVWGYLFLLPNVVGFLAFTAFAVLIAFVLALSDWDMLSPIWTVQVTGPANYVKLVTNDPVFRQVLGNTTFFVVGVVPLEVIGSLVLALLLNTGVR